MEKCFAFTKKYGSRVMKSDFKAWLKHFKDVGRPAAIMLVRKTPKTYQVWRTGTYIQTDGEAIDYFKGTVVEEVHGFSEKIGLNNCDGKDSEVDNG